MRLARPLALLLIAGALAAATRQWIDVPFVRQEREGCGSAAASMVMRHWMVNGARVDPDAADAAAIQRALHSSSAKGIYASSLRRYFERHGFTVHLVHGEMEDLQHHVARGRPLIACLEPRRGDLHYVVVVGIDQDKDEVIVHDPARGSFLREKGAGFRERWKATGNWTLLAVPTP
ncbi:MAG TPA: C39 family peptidase [Bryobacteraceae bacterium]|nr:C39 family peptidase [Bryobacteraceae bacterium]